MAYYKFTKHIKENKKIVLFNDGNMARDMTYIDDIIDGITRLLQFLESSNKSIHDVFNLGNNYPITTIKLINEIEKILDQKADIDYAKSLNEMKRTNADLSKSREILGYNPKIGFESGIRFINWYNLKNFSPGGEIGRHKGLKIPRRKLRAGSSPAWHHYYHERNYFSWRTWVKTLSLYVCCLKADFTCL